MHKAAVSAGSLRSGRTAKVGITSFKKKLNHEVGITR
jgi:hypothetical protein